MRIGFVFTNFNNSHYTRDAINSIMRNKFEVELFIVIVDNKSTYKEVELLKEIEKDFTGLHIIFNNENLGYFRGLNLGIRYIRENRKDINYIIVGNNDLIFQPNFIDSLFSSKQIFERYPVVSPNIITLDGFHQNPHVVTKVGKMRRLIYDIYYFSYGMAKFINLIAKKTNNYTGRKDQQQFNTAQTILMGFGACYILGPLFFKHFDQLWAPTFLMGEEFFLSKQLESKKLKIFYIPSIIVIHQEHASVSQIPKKNLWQYSQIAYKISKKINDVSDFVI